MNVNIKDLSKEELGMTIEEYLISKQSQFIIPDLFISQIKDKFFVYHKNSYVDCYIGNPILNKENNTVKFESYVIKNQKTKLEGIEKEFFNVRLNFYIEDIQKECKEITAEEYHNVEKRFITSYKSIIQQFNTLIVKYASDFPYQTKFVFDNAYSKFDSFNTFDFSAKKPIQEIVNEKMKALNRKKEINQVILNKWFFYLRDRCFLKFSNLNDDGSFLLTKFYQLEDGISIRENIPINSPSIYEIYQLQVDDELLIDNLFNQFNNLLK